MVSFFEKLKRGMGVEEPIEEPVEKETKKQTKKKLVKKTKAPALKEEQSPLEDKIEEVKKIEIKEIPIEEEIKKESKKEIEKEKNWFEEEGQLAIDVYQTKNDLVIQSAVAGVKPENLDITLEKDMLTIKGSREKMFEEEGTDYFSQECFWGAFSKEIILPVEVDPNRVTAEMKEGILTIRIPKILREKKRKISVKS